MKLSRREAKARVGIIQENHLDKRRQIRLDKWIVDNQRTYRSLYEDKKETVVVIARIALAIATENMAAAFRAMGMGAHEATAVFYELGRAVGKRKEEEQ